MKTIDRICIELGRRQLGLSSRVLTAREQKALTELQEADQQKRCQIIARLNESKLGQAAREAALKARRERLEEELPHWIEAIERFQGNYTLIAERMGCCRDTAVRAIRDLGLTEARTKAARPVWSIHEQ